MTSDEWDDLRLQAARRDDPVWGHVLTRQRSADPFVPPPAGSWFRPNRHDLPPGLDERLIDHFVDQLPAWHLYAGDLRWGPAWRGPALAAACGFEDGPRVNGELRSSDVQPPRACPRCAGAALGDTPQ